METVDASLLHSVEESKTFVLHFYDPVEDSAPHVYHSALPMVPKSSFLRTWYQHELSGEVSVVSGVADSWDGSIRTIEAGYAVTSIAFSKKGGVIAVGGDRVQIFETATGVCVGTLEHEWKVQSVTFSPDDTLVATGSYDNVVRIWDVETGELGESFVAHTGGVNSVAFSPDGAKIASASSDHSVRVWDVASGTCETTLEGHTDAVRSVCWLRAGNEVVSGAWDGTVKVWDTLTAVASQTFTVSVDEVIPVWSITTSLDSHKIAAGCGDGNVHIFDVRAEEKLVVIEATGGGVRAVDFSPDGNQLAYTPGSSIYVWNIREALTTSNFECQDRIFSAVFSPDGTKIATGSIDGLVNMWKVDHRASAEKRADVVQGVKFSPDGTMIATGSDLEDVQLWDAATVELLHTFEDSPYPTSTLAFSPDGVLLACGYVNGAVWIWNVSDHSLFCTTDGHDDYVNAVGFSRDNKHVVTASYDGKVILWNLLVNDGIARMKLATVAELPYRTLNFDRLIFTEDGTIFTLQNDYDLVARFTIELTYVPVYQDANEPIPSRKQLIFDLDEELASTDPPPLFSPTQEWILDREGRRVFWLPSDRRGPSIDHFGQRLVLGTRNGNLVILDFSATMTEQLIIF